MQFDYDYIIIGSGFGGSVSALRLSQKGYRVLVLEKGKWWRAEDFAKNNWQLRRWLWAPRLGMRGIFKMTFLNHITALSGVGVGGGDLLVGGEGVVDLVDGRRLTKRLGADVDGHRHRHRD